MHKALHVDEILVMIFQICIKSRIGWPLAYPTRRIRPDSECRSWFAEVTKTCRTFYEPAMDVLWQTLDDITPLFKCLPQNLWLETRDYSSYLRSYVVVFVSTSVYSQKGIRS